jgi:hypothetical protein
VLTRREGSSAPRAGGMRRRRSRLLRASPRRVVRGLALQLRATEPLCGSCSRWMARRDGTHVRRGSGSGASGTGSLAPARDRANPTQRCGGIPVDATVQQRAMKVAHQRPDVPACPIPPRRQSRLSPLTPDTADTRWRRAREGTSHQRDVTTSSERTASCCRGRARTGRSTPCRPPFRPP